MRYFALTVTLLAAAAAAATAQAVPDFSGTWQMDTARSDAAAQTDFRGPVTVIVTQTAKDLRLETTTPRGTVPEVYTMAPAESDPVSAPATAPATSAKPALARWKGAALLTQATRDVRGQSVSVQQTRTLSADGNEMTVESIVNVQHGYTVAGAQTFGTSKDVYVRVKG